MVKRKGLSMLGEKPASFAWLEQLDRLLVKEINVESRRTYLLVDMDTT